MRILGGLNAVILGLALMPVAGFAGNLRSMKEVHAELAALEALGIDSKQFKGMSLVPPEEVFTNSKIFYPLLDTVQSFVKDSKYGSAFHSSDDNRLIKHADVQARMFRVWVELLRYGVRSENKLIRNLTIGKMSPVAAIDYDLIDDVLNMAFAAPADENKLRSIKDALHCFERCMNFSMNDDGIVQEDLHNKDSKAIGAYIRMKLLAPWSAKAPKENRAQRMKRSADLLSHNFGETPFEGWKVIADFIKNEWSTSSVEVKKDLVEVIEGLSLRDHDAADLMLEVDRAKRIVPLRVALIKSSQHFAFGYERTAKWMRAMSEDPSQAIRAGAAFAIGASGAPDDVGILNRMFAKDPDQNVRIRAAFALGSFWERHGTTDSKEVAFAKLAQVFVSSTGPFRNSLGRALSMWHAIPATTMAAYGLTGKVIEECEEAIISDSQAVGTAAAMEDIWMEEGSAESSDSK